MKNFKKIITLLLAVCMIVSVFALSSCGKKDKGNSNDSTNGGNNNTNTGKTYTVTIVDGDNNPVKDAVIGIMADTYQSFTTNTEGKITFSTDATSVTGKIISVPDEYEKPENTNLSFASSKDLTVKISKKVSSLVTYTITVKDQYGAPVNNVLVQLCTDKMCHDVTTGEDGIGNIDLNPNEKYDVKIPYPISGYVAESGYFTSIEIGETEIEIVITKI